MRKLYFILLLCFPLGFAYGQTVTALNSFYRSGQVFLTWQNIPNSDAYYKVYRSLTPITDSSQLASCEYLGYVNRYSAKDFNLSLHDSAERYLRLDSAGTPLSVGTGLFAATTLVNGNYYYAVTSLLNNAENKKITAGTNSSINPITESVAKPLPVFQEQRLLSDKPYRIYTTFFSSKRDVNLPPFNAVGFMAFDLALYLNNAISNKPLNIRFHPGGVDFVWNVTSVKTDEINLDIEDATPTGDNLGDWGCNEHYDVYKLNEDNIPPPVTGINYNLVQLRINETLDWAINHLPVDSNRIYLYGDSNGAPGAYFYAITYPERIAAAKVVTGCFNFAFDSDYDPSCTLNAGKANRVDGDNRMGSISSNLMCNLGIHTYDALNGGWVIHNYKERNWPVIYSINGKYDTKMGWTEKPIYYDSVNDNMTGGYYFWDNRDHSGIGKVWTDNNFNVFRYRKDLSYPAFSNCSNDEAFGDGHASSGGSYGSINGSLDWKNEVTEDALNWELKAFVRNLTTTTIGTVVYPDSATADVTPRRLHVFKPISGQLITWTVKHKNVVIQSGSFTYSSGLITIPNVKIFRDTSVIHLTITSNLNAYYFDGDLDGYGTPNQVVFASTPPPGYVADNTDCNDSNAAIHPGAVDMCNNIDDNCNGVLDDNAIVATITPSAPVTVCKGVVVNFTANTGSGLKYQWIKASANLAGATNQTYSTTVSGNYSVSESNNFNCVATSAKTKITTIAKPSATITPQGSLDICGTGSVVLKANTGAGLTYQWKKGSSNISGATNNSYTATTTGSYKVNVTNSSGCDKISSPKTVTKSCKDGVSESDEVTGLLSCYPNPTSGMFSIHLKLGADVNAETKVRVINMIGQVVYEKSVPIINGEMMDEIQLDAVAANGWYLVNVITDDRFYQGKVMYER